MKKIKLILNKNKLPEYLIDKADKFITITEKQFIHHIMRSFNYIGILPIILILFLLALPFVLGNIYYIIPAIVVIVIIVKYLENKRNISITIEMDEFYNNTNAKINKLFDEANSVFAIKGANGTNYLGSFLKYTTWITSNTTIASFCELKSNKKDINIRYVFLPHMMFVASSSSFNKYASFNYSNLNIAFSKKQEESLNPPFDSVIISKRWEHAKKDSDKDLRFKSNNQLIKVFIGYITFTYIDSILFTLSLSNHIKAENFFNEMQQLLNEQKIKNSLESNDLKQNLNNIIEAPLQMNHSFLDKIFTGIVKIVMKPSTDRLWQSIQDDPELKKRKEELVKIQSELELDKNKLRNNTKAMEFLKSIGADVDFLLNDKKDK